MFSYWSLIVSFLSIKNYGPATFLYYHFFSDVMSISIMKLSSANEMVQKNLWNLFIERVPPAEQFCKEELEYGKTNAGILHSVANSHVI